MNGLSRHFTTRVVSSRARITRVMFALATAGLFTSACERKGPIEPGTLESISISPNPQTLAINGTQQFTAVGIDFGGDNVAISPVWSIVAGGGFITSTGMFTAGPTMGTYTNTVKAELNGLSTTATITLTVGPLASIVVTPDPITLSAGVSQQFTAVGRDASGNIVTFTPVWSVVAGGGTINGSALFTAGTTPGTFTNTVTASSGIISDAATVIVTAGPLATITITPTPVTLGAGGVQQFTAVGRDAAGNVVAITPTWSVVASGGSIDATTGLFTAGAVGGTFTNTVRATSGSFSGFATVIVNSAPVTPGLATITVTPNPTSVQVNTTRQFTADGANSSGGSVAITPVWSIVNGGGNIDANTGLFTAGAVAGTFTSTVRATSGAISGFATVTVTTGITPVGPLATITVAPNPATLLTNATQLFTAIGRDANGALVTITPVWTVVNGGGAINSGSGLFTAGGVTGTFANTVMATSGTTSGTATVIVTGPAPVAPFVNLGAAALNGIMAGTAVTCVSGGSIQADVSISPGNTITGFGPCVITGVQHLNDAVAQQGQIDLTNAYNTLAGLPCPPANFIVADLGGTVKPAGVYCSASGIGVTGPLTLDGNGDPNAVFVFQAGSSLTTAGSVILIGGAQAKNVYWQVGSSATIGTASAWQGNILALTSITLVDNSTLFGRALARNGAVTLGTNNVIILP
jgi:hypothetical protein